LPVFIKHIYSTRHTSRRL